MSTFKARGIVLKEYTAGEADKKVTLLLKERGKMTVFAKGAHKTGSKFLQTTQQFAYCDYVIYAGSGFFSIASAMPIYHFYDLSADYAKFCTGAYLMELTEKVILENSACDDILYLLLKTLKNIEKGLLSPGILRSVYEFKFLQLNGYSPEILVCIECGEKVKFHSDCVETSQHLPPIFSGYGTVCGKCAKTHSYGLMPASAGLMNAITYILSADIKKLFSFRIDERICSELKKAAGIFLSAHIDVKLKSAEFLNSGNL